MKIIAQVLVYNEGDCVKEAIEPWVPVCEQIDIFEGAFQTTVNLGYPKRSNDKTIEICSELDKKFCNVDLHLHNHWNEPILRNEHLLSTIRQFGRDDTCLFILDGDEIYSRDDINKCVTQVTSEFDQYNRWWVSMKNYINPNEYYLGFRVPRFAKLKNAVGFDSYNGIMYSDGVRETDIKDVLPKHVSWTPLEKAKRKIEWQTISLNWQCSFKIQNSKVILNENYYQNNLKPKPVILKDDEIHDILLPLNGVGIH